MNWQSFHGNQSDMNIVHQQGFLGLDSESDCRLVFYLRIVLRTVQTKRFEEQVAGTCPKKPV